MPLNRRFAKVPLFANPGKSVVVDLTATNGATLGQNLLDANGDAITIDKLRTILGTGGGSSRLGDITTDQVAEGKARLYFTSARVYAAAKAILKPGSNITITADDGAQTLTIASTGGGGSGDWELVKEWDGATDGPVVEVVASGMEKYSECYVILDAVTLSANSWRYVMVSIDGGSTYLLSYDVNTSGVVSAGPSPLHSASSSAARSCGARIPLIAGPNATIFYDQPARSPAATLIRGVTAKVTDVRVTAQTASVINLTGGIVQIWGR